MIQQTHGLLQAAMVFLAALNVHQYIVTAWPANGDTESRIACLSHMIAPGRNCASSLTAPSFSACVRDGAFLLQDHCAERSSLLLQLP